MTLITFVCVPRISVVRRVLIAFHFHYSPCDREHANVCGKTPKCIWIAMHFHSKWSQLMRAPKRVRCRRRVTHSSPFSHRVRSCSHISKPRQLIVFFTIGARTNTAASDVYGPYARASTNALLHRNILFCCSSFLILFMNFIRFEIAEEYMNALVAARSWKNINSECVRGRCSRWIFWVLVFAAAQPNDKAIFTI